MEAGANGIATIFYTDDDADDLCFFADAVNQMAANFSFFQHGENMLQTLRNTLLKPSLIFVDLNMPAISGFDILGEIKKSPLFNKIPVVILTTSRSTVDIEKCMNLGAGLYICKPNSIQELKKAIKYVLGIDWNTFNPTKEEFVYT